MARAQIRRQRQPLVLEVVGKRLSRSVGSAEDGLIHRLRQIGIDPNAIHMPPPIEDIEAGVLPPPATGGRCQFGLFGTATPSAMMEPKGGEEAMVNVERLNRDLKILLAMFGREGVTWQIDPQRGGFIIIKHLPLPPNVHPRVTGLKVAVPDNLYQRSGRGWVFYKDIWVDPGLKVRYPRWTMGSDPPAITTPLIEVTMIQGGATFALIRKVSSMRR